MRNALIVSDSPSIASVLQSHFLTFHWSCDVLSVGQPMIKCNQPQDYACVVMVIDTGFLARYGRVIQEMGQFFRNMAQKSSFYLVFEGEYDPSFASWLEHTRQIFKQATQHPKLQDTMHEIILLESEEVPRTAFVSSVDSE